MGNNESIPREIDKKERGGSERILGNGERERERE